MLQCPFYASVPFLCLLYIVLHSILYCTAATDFEPFLKNQTETFANCVIHCCNKRWLFIHFQHAFCTLRGNFFKETVSQVLISVKEYRIDDGPDYSFVLKSGSKDSSQMLWIQIPIRIDFDRMNTNPDPGGQNRPTKK
jgi:hypothetical protein